MAKMKSSRTLAKRIKVTGTGKLKRKKAYMGHFAPNKTRKQRKHRIFCRLQRHAPRKTTPSFDNVFLHMFSPMADRGSALIQGLYAQFIV